MVLMLRPAQGWVLRPSLDTQEGSPSASPENCDAPFDWRDPLRADSPAHDPLSLWCRHRIAATRTKLAASAAILLNMSRAHGVKLPAEHSQALSSVTAALAHYASGSVDAYLPLRDLSASFGVAPLADRTAFFPASPPPPPPSPRPVARRGGRRGAALARKRLAGVAMSGSDSDSDSDLEESGSDSEASDRGDDGDWATGSKRQQWRSAAAGAPPPLKRARRSCSGM